MTKNFGVAIQVDPRTGKKNWSKIYAFQIDHYERIIDKGIAGGWQPFPKVPCFISFNEYNRPFMEYLAKDLSESPLLRPVVVEANRRGGIELAFLVTSAIEESTYMIPILSEVSIKTQFVNQEIGYAKAVKDLKIIPIVERKIIHNLKGFVHNQLQLPYLFDIDEGDPRRPTIPNMIALVTKLLDDLQEEVAKKFNISLWEK